jgi:hypothetical protein
MFVVTVRSCSTSAYAARSAYARYQFALSIASRVLTVTTQHIRSGLTIRGEPTRRAANPKDRLQAVHGVIAQVCFVLFSKKNLLNCGYPWNLLRQSRNPRLKQICRHQSA